jgi:SAM-dependent methyltransferase
MLPTSRIKIALRHGKAGIRYIAPGPLWAAYTELESSYDAVTMSHVIEHVYDPLAPLQECHRLIKPGGKLVVLTPNIDSFGHRNYGADWVALDPPRHLLLFSPVSLAAAAWRIGFTDVCVHSTAVRAQILHIASEDIRRSGRHSLHQRYRIRQLMPAICFELRAWSALRSDPICGDELVLEAIA